MRKRMRTFAIEFRKEKRTGVCPLMLAVGVLGAAYAFAFFHVRKDALFNLPLAPMDILLTQVYGVMMILNMFGVIVAACMIYNMEFRGNAVKKMYLLPVSVPAMYLGKFLIMVILLLAAVCFQHLTLARIGTAGLPQGAFDLGILLSFAGYAFATSLPVLSFMLLVSSRCPNMWVSLGVGVAGFLSGMAFAVWDRAWLCIHPFVAMLKPAVAMSAQPDGAVVMVSLAETVFFLCIGLLSAKNLRYE